MAEKAVTLEDRARLRGEFQTQRLSVADERLKRLEAYPVCNRSAIQEQLERIAQLEADVLTAIRGY